MIIGIDETGNFDPISKEKQFFTAISIDQNNGKHCCNKSGFSNGSQQYQKPIVKVSMEKLRVEI